MEQRDKVDGAWWPSNSECDTGNKNGAPLGIQPGLIETAHHPGRDHSYDTRTHTREHSEALPALGSEKRAHGVLLKRRQIRLPRTTRDVTHKPLKQGKKSCAKARGRKVILAKTSYTSRIEESTGTRPATQWAFNTWALFLYITTDGCLDMTPLPCPSVEHHPPEPQGPIASDQASVSATLECQETLEAAEALMTLKNSSWTWRQTHS
ncbi:hypothetical protein I79_024395 [Cricetulus griseus]|uniref:Doublesex- and mab-3-related transcription factor C1/C2 C-terminal domain-containing protein n=1 Tax=Cricetulus griseus TaxID=10029 RepID=G3IKJ2_CRIGR|nr:hypothetical protein I79_024395 [Cricetulus griseus]